MILDSKVLFAGSDHMWGGTGVGLVEDFRVRTTVVFHHLWPPGVAFWGCGVPGRKM